MCPRVLITGGLGDLALAIEKVLQENYVVASPSRHELDVTDSDAIEAFFRENDPFNIVINNAGTIHVATVLGSQRAKWIEDIQVNLIAPYLVSKSALEINPNVIIINIASTAGYAAYKEWSAYCAAKAGVISLTKSMAAEGVNAYAIALGAINTKFRGYLNLPNDNMLEPQDVAKLVLDIMSRKYEPGVSLFVRKGVLEVR